ncbi:MAG: thioredoxin domain-containing protein [Sphingomonadaceae bacterium]
MKRTIVLAAFALVAAAPVNWANSVRQAPSGAMVRGNPAAKVKLVEYLSFSCPHCAAFVSEAKVPLTRDYVAKGTATVEVRNAVRDRYDFAAALLARCGGPARFFGNADALMAGQQSWMSQAVAFDRANSEKMAKLPINDSLKLIVQGTGLATIMKARGFTLAQINACLISKSDQQKISAMTNEAWNGRKIAGTPAFLINDTLSTEPGTWAAIDTQLKTALAAQ